MSAEPDNQIQNLPNSPSHKLSSLHSLEYSPSRKNEGNLSLSQVTPKRRIIINPQIDLVSKLDMDQNGEEYSKRKINLQILKNRIDSSEEIALKRKNKFTNGDSLLRSKAENLQKIEIKEYERKTEQKLKEQTELVSNKRKEYDKVCNTINKIYEENNLIDIEYKILDNFKEYVKPKYKPIQTYASSIEISKEGDLIEKKTKLSKEHQYFQIHNIESQIVQRNQTKVSLIETKEQNIKALSDLKAKSEILLKELKKLRQDKENLRRELSDHYHLQLYEGLDFRSEGLISLIKSIWNIGMDVDISFMPRYLDSACVDFLFSLARDTIELIRLKQKVENEKYDCSVELGIIGDGNKCEWESNLFDTRVNLKQNQNEKRKDETKEETDPYTQKIMEKRQKQKEEETYTLKEVCSKLLNKKQLNKKVVEHFSKLDKLEYLLKRMEMKISERRKREILRISKEFLLNGYENKFNVGIETMIAAICGENAKNAEMVHFTKMEHSFHDQLKSIKYYSTFKNEKL